MRNNPITKTADDFEKLLNKLTKNSGDTIKKVAEFVLAHKKLFITGFLLYLLTTYFLSEEE